MKNPTEIDRDLLIRMHSMYRVKDAPYCPVVLYFPYFGNEKLKEKWNALYHLLEHAYEKTIEKFSGCFDAVLVEKKGLPFKELVYLNTSKEQAVSFMYEMLKTLSITDSEEEENSDWSCYGKYFVTLSPEEISLFDNEKLNVYSSENAVLYEVCKKADLEAIKAAVQSGANVNGFCSNFYGSVSSTPIQVLLGTVENYDDGQTSIHHTEAEIQNVITCIEYLLEQGADINLYAFGDDDVLENTFSSRNKGLINFMFEHGLRIQQNSNVLDFDDSYSIYDLYQQSWLMEHYWWRGYEYGDDYSDMELLMEQHGMSWYINNYTKEMLEEVEKQFISFCQFNSL